MVLLIFPLACTGGDDKDSGAATSAPIWRTPVAVTGTLSMHHVAPSVPDEVWSDWTLDTFRETVDCDKPGCAWHGDELGSCHSRSVQGLEYHNDNDMYIEGFARDSLWLGGATGGCGAGIFDLWVSLVWEDDTTAQVVAAPAPDGPCDQHFGDFYSVCEVSGELTFTW